ncbi:hemagluttinin repeat-containing protein [Spirochaeta thermophila DSM 6578]|uniref:Hemagluttinin repeat-containing protein n=2 Tax=Winmispira thermophila TaxID=154 RepID=G0GBL1_WINT7|nr:hemagluttinin repeat-containing protein [Spirochaeta thermophila DSM 6578]
MGFGSGTLFGQSAIPAQSGNYLQVTGTPQNGDEDPYMVLFYEVPDTITSTLYFAVEHPGLSGAAPDQGTGGTWEFFLVGGAGALTQSRMLNFANDTEVLAGTVLSTIQATNETGWVYFDGVLPSQGEHIGNRYYFKIVAKAPNGNKNGFRCDVSYSNSGTPTGDSSIRAFAYVWTLALLDNVGRLWDLYPFVPDSAGPTDTIDYKNWDMDGGADTLAAWDKSGNPLTAPTPSGDGATWPDDVATTSYTIGSETNGTWHLQITEGNGGEPAINTSLFWFTLNDTTADDTDVPLRAYSAPYTPPAPDHVVISPDAQTVQTGQTASLTLQIVDASGSPVPYVRNLYVTVSGSATISPDNNGTPQTELLTTSSDGIATFTVTDGSAETVTVTVYWDGTGGSDSFGTSSYATATVDVAASLPPVISSAANTTIPIGTGPYALADVTVTDVSGGQVTAANGIRIRLGGGLSAQFDAAVVSLTTSGTAVSNGRVANPVTPTYESGNTVVFIPVLVDFSAGESVTISGLALDSATLSPSSGYLELSVDGGTTWVSVDDKVIVLQGSSYVWDGDTSTSWTDGNNWQGGVAPPDDGTAEITLPAGCTYYPQLVSGESHTVAQVVVTTGGSLTLDAGSSLAVNGGLQDDGAVTVSGTLTVSGLLTVTGSLEVQGGGSVSAGTVSSGGTIQSAGDITTGDFTSTGSFTSTGVNTITASGDVSISGTFSDPSARCTLTMSGPSTSLTSSQALGNLVLSGTASVGLGSSLSLAGGLSVPPGTTLDAAGFDVDVAGTVTVGGMFDALGITLTVGGDLSVTGTLTLTGATCVLDGAGSQDVTLGGAQPATLRVANTGGVVRFTDAVTTDTLQVVSAGSVTFEGDLTVNTSASLAAAGYDLAFNAGAGGQTTSFPGGITFPHTGSLGLGNAAADSFQAAGILTATACSSVQLGGTVSTAGAGGDVSLGDADTPVTLAADTTVDAGTGGVTLGGTVDGGYVLTVSAGGAVSFGGVVGGVTALAGLDASGGSIVVGGDVVATGDVVMGGPVVLGADVVVDTSGGSGDVVFSSTVDGGYVLTVRAGGAVSFGGAVGGVTALAGLDASGGSIAVGGDVVATGDVVMGGPVVLGADVVVDTSGGSGDVVFSSTVDGTWALTVQGGTGNIVFSGDIGGTTPLGALTIVSGAQVDLGGSVYTSDADLSIAPPVRLTSAATDVWIEPGTGNITFGTTVEDSGSGAHNLILVGGGNLTFSGDVGATNEPAYLILDIAGDITISGNVRAGNFVLYNGTVFLNGNTIETTTGDVVLFGPAYGEDDPETTPVDTNFRYPDMAGLAAVYDPGSYDGTFDAASLGGSTIDVGQNFYANGVDLSASSAWTLDIPDNSASQRIAYPVPGGAYGTGSGTYAVAYNCTVAYSNAGPGVVSASTGNGNTDGGNNSGWDFTPPAIGATVETLSDNVLHVTFSEDLENSNGEITAAVQAGLIRFHDGSGTYTFDEVYQDAACTIPLPPGDTDEFYLKATGPNEAWNTDATGADPGDADSTDTGGTHRTLVPRLYIEKGALFDAGKNPIGPYGINGGGPDTSAVDKAPPVLYKVEYGRADPAAAANTDYHGHNFFHLYYSEQVTIGTLGTGAANERSEDSITNKGGDIEDDGGTHLVVEGYFSIDFGAPVSMERGVRPGTPGGNSSNALYRTLPGLITSPDHEVVIFLSGYHDGTGWPGWHRNVPDPAGGTIDEVYDLGGQIEDNSPANNPLDTSVLPTFVLSSTGSFDLDWDVDPPALAPYTLAAGRYEGVTIDSDWNGRIDRIDFHFLDDGSAPWDSSTDHPDSQGGIRDILLNYPGDSLNELEAFMVGETGGGSFVSTYNQAYGTGVDNSLFGGSISISDDPYFSLSLSSSAPWGLLTDISVRYDHTKAYLTDLAGNLLEDIDPEVPIIERVPPRIVFSLARAGDDKVYLRFSEPVFGDTAASVEIDAADFTVTGATGVLTVTGLQILTRWPANTTGAWEAYLLLAQPLTADDVVQGTVRANANAVYDPSGNAMDPADIFRITNVGLGVVSPLWATDGVHADEVGGSSLRGFDGSGALLPRDITLQARILAPSISGDAMLLVYDVDPDASYYMTTDEYNRTTFPDMWWPVSLPGLKNTANTEARTVSPFSSQGALRTFLIPGTDPEMREGGTVEFLFYIDNLYCARLTDEDDPRTIAPWSFGLSGLKEQRAGVTILNNVINPTQGEVTVVNYRLSRAGMVTIQVFALDGSLVRTLQRGVQGPGAYTVAWDGRNGSGRVVARGLYFIRVVGPGIDEYRKVMVVK